MIQTTPLARVESAVISPAASIREAMARLDDAGTGALALCQGNRKLAGLLTDGDVRRALLQSRSLDDPSGTISNPEPIVALHPVSSAEALRLMSRHDIDHLPVVDGEGILRDFLLRRDLVSELTVEGDARQRLENVLISPVASISQAIAHLDKAGTGALLLCREGRILRGLLTDGDIRRAILNGRSMGAPCETIASLTPQVARWPISAGEALHMMNEHDINHLPVVDGDHRVLELLLRKDLVVESHPNLPAVIMAGGYGKRLLPLTQSMPKPMLPIGDRPLLELTIQQLRRSGICDIYLTTHYMPESIKDYFGNGQDFGIRINYQTEAEPLGTAGGLKQLKRPQGSFLVINGDILTAVPFQEMLTYHQQHHAILTVGVRKYDMQVPYGVVECDDVRITKLQEKPFVSFFINAGIYLLEPSAADYIPDGQAFDMTDLIQKLLEAGQRVVSFPIMEYWLDIGRHEDYEKAQEDVLNGRI